MSNILFIKINSQNDIITPMETIVLAVVLYKNKILGGKLKKSVRQDFGGVPYVLPGGEVAQNEKPINTAKRKVFEECGLEVDIVKEISQRIHPLSKKKIIYFLCKPVSLYPNQLENKKEREFEKFLWIDVKDISRYMLTLYTKVYAEILKSIQFRWGRKNTTLLSYLNQDIDFYAGKIRSGEIVAFPTETVYGIGANAYDADAVKKIFAIKQRPANNPLIVHISSTEDIKLVASQISKVAMNLIETFWPGPLTVVLKKNELIPNIVTAGLDTVAVRNPNNAFALELIQSSNVPIAAPSANISGRPSATHHRYIKETFKDKLPILKGGKCPIGVESTVVNTASKDVQILRQGGLPKEKIEKVIGKIRVYIHNALKDKKPPSPGMMYRHYAPKTKLELIPYSKDMKNKLNNAVMRYLNQNKKVGVICTKEYRKHIPKNVIVKVIGSEKNLSNIAKNIFSSLIEMDKKDMDIILCQSFPDKMLGGAIMDRLKRASSRI